MSIDKICRYCKKEINSGCEVVTRSYWHAVEDICHKECKDAGYKNEAYECQCIDADCNDCKHFFRDSMIPAPYKYFPGWCLKLDKPTKAFALTCTNHTCFTHRKSDEK